MNIIVKTKGGSIYCRPDTTWERENKDLYTPDFIESFSFTPVLFARISKAGKFVGAKYANRYYDGIGFGILLYASDQADGTLASIAETSCIDHTSFLPQPLYNPVVLESDTNDFNLRLDDKVIYSNKPNAFCTGHIEEAICLASGRVSLRIGDMICIELDDPSTFLSPDNLAGTHHLQAEFAGNDTLNLQIIK